MIKLIMALMLGVSLFVFSGCAVFKGKISKDRSLDAQGPSILGEQEPAAYLTASERAALVIVGFNLLEDKREQEDISYMTSVREKVSSEILKTLRSIQLFDEIHFPASENDSIIISGEIRKFNWKSFDTMISYIPGLNVLPFLGLPSTRTRTEVEIYLEIKYNKTKEVILGFNESYEKHRIYNMYNFKVDKANKELAYCFDVVLNKLKEKIILKKNEILEAVKPESVPISKPAKEVKPEPAPISKPVEEVKPDENLKVPASEKSETAKE